MAIIHYTLIIKLTDQTFSTCYLRSYCKVQWLF